jgi:hypothetical protein
MLMTHTPFMVLRIKMAFMQASNKTVPSLGKSGSLQENNFKL